MIEVASVTSLLQFLVGVQCYIYNFFFIMLHL